MEHASEFADSSFTGGEPPQANNHDIMASRNFSVAVDETGELIPATEDQFRLLVDSIQDYAIFLLDANGRIASWNEGARRIYGYSDEDIIGADLSVFYSPDAVTDGEPRRNLRSAVQAGHFAGEGWRLRKNGTRFWADVNISALQSSAGQFTGYGIVVRDMTGRKQTQHEIQQIEERFRLLVEGVQEYAIFMLDPRGNVVSWNAGAQRIKGYTEDEIIGQNFAVFHTPEDRAQGRPERSLQLAAENDRFGDEGWRVRKDGTRFWAYGVLSAVRDPSGRLIGFGKVTRDLTERVRAEDERIKLVREQERRAAAERAVQLREEFLSVAAHELKTPVSSLNLAAQVIRKRVDLKGTIDLDRLNRSLDVIIGQSQKIGHLVSQLLDVSRITNSRLALEPVVADVTQLLSQLVAVARDTAPHHQILFEPTEEILAPLDPLRIEQVITNLLDNAVKFSPNGGDILVQIERRGEDLLELSVRDHGIGIPVENRDHIFDRFFQAHEMAHQSGFGLGLFICREITTMHGGTIRAEFPDDGGTRILVVLPACPPGTTLPQP